MNETRKAASLLSKGAKVLTDTARKIRALDAISASLTEEQRRDQFSKVVGELRAFRSTTLQTVIDTLQTQCGEIASAE
jgi:hypothetical protein